MIYVQVLGRMNFKMRKKLILVASPPACGKTYVSELIAKSVEHIVYLDKDDLCDLLRAAFVVSGNEIDMDGEFYINNLRFAEYSAILDIAFSALRFEDYVILNAPFGKEVRDAEYMQALKNRAEENDTQLLLIWVMASEKTCFERMKKRNSDRDLLKLQNFEQYVKQINFTPPYELEAAGAVDGFIVFDNSDDASIKRCLNETLKMILEDDNA